MKVKVLMLIYNPTSGPAFSNRKIHQVFPFLPSIDGLVRDYIDDMTRAGRGAFSFEIVERYDLDELAPATIERLVSPEGELLIENHQWTSRDAFFRNVSNIYGSKTGTFVDLFNNGRADYPAVINDPRFDIPHKVDAGTIDMVWVLGPPGSGFWEAAMAGPGAYWVNGGPIDGIASSRRFVILAHGYDRDVACWLEVTAHMTENILSRVSRRWPLNRKARNRAGVETSFNEWDYFTLTETQNYDDRIVAPGYAQVGTAHFPPNAPRDSNYAFAFTDQVTSGADDWFTYPELKGLRKTVNRETWNTFNGDYHRGFLNWWFGHIPSAPGSHDGVLNNWWRYIWDVNRDPDRLEP